MLSLHRRAAALDLLRAQQHAIHWQGMQPDTFACFYRFVFFLCREYGKRNVLVSWRAAAAAPGL